jgi:outer membrane protein TolC
VGRSLVLFVWLGAACAPAARAQERLPVPPPSAEEPVLLQGAEAAKAEPVQEEPELGPAPGTPTLALADAVQVAVQQNFGILSAADALVSARIREDTSRAQFYPKLTPRILASSDDRGFYLDLSQRLPWTGGSITASGGVRSIDGDGVPAAKSSDVRLLWSQPLLRGFGPNATYYDLTNSKRAKEAQERSFTLSRQRLAVQVASTFYSVVQQRQLLAVARQSYNRSDALRRASEARLEVGLVSKLDVFRAELQASQGQEAMVRTRAALETALEQFRYLLGLPPDHPVEPVAVTLPEAVEQDIEPVEILVGRAIATRLELQELRDQVGDARRTFSLARQNLLPQLDLNLQLTRQGFGPSYGNAFNGGINRLSFFLASSYPIERSADKANRNLSELDLASRERNLRQREMEIASEVRSAVRELDRLMKSIDLQRKAVEVAQQQRRLATLRYQRGLASNFDVVDAEGSLVLARSTLVSLVTSYQVQRIDLLRVVGTLDVEKEFAP